MAREEESSTNLGLAIGGLLPIGLAAALVPLRDVTSNANIALALVITVVLASVIGGRSAGMLAAVSAALSFDFFHTRPYLRLTIDTRDDVETTILLLVVGLVVGAIASQARRARASAESGRSEIRRIHRVAEQAAGGGEPAELIASVQTELIGLLDLQDCRFEAPPYEETYLRLERTGTVAGVTVHRLTRTGFELPPDGVELQVLSRGQPVGRFVLFPKPGIGASLEQRVVAVALADQVGATLGAPSDRRGRHG